MTKPDAGLGVNNVDLRGMRSPAAATAATAATGVARKQHRDTVAPAVHRLGHGMGVSDGGLVIGQAPRALDQHLVQDPDVERRQRRRLAPAASTVDDIAVGVADDDGALSRR